MAAPHYVENEEKILADFILKGLAIGGIYENGPLRDAGEGEIEDALFDPVEPQEAAKKGPHKYKGDVLAFALVGKFGEVKAAHRAFNEPFQERSFDPIGVACEVLHITEQLGHAVSDEHLDGTSAEKIAQKLLREGRWYLAGGMPAS